jgi:hypothetical protein
MVLYLKATWHKITQVSLQSVQGRGSCNEALKKKRVQTMIRYFCTVFRGNLAQDFPRVSVSSPGRIGSRPGWDATAFFKGNMAQDYSRVIATSPGEWVLYRGPQVEERPGQDDIVVGGQEEGDHHRAHASSCTNRISMFFPSKNKMWDLPFEMGRNFRN